MESDFDWLAKPARQKIFKIIPFKRPSSSLGYSQAVKGTWEQYKKETNNKLATRVRFKDSVNFIGWYTDKTEKLLKISKKKYPLFIEIKPTFSKKLLQKLLKETSKFLKCVFISFKHENIYNLLKIKSNTKVGLSFSPPTSVKTIIKKSNNKKIDCLILDKFFLKNKSIKDLEIKKYYYTIKTKLEFKKYSKNNNLIFENL